MTHIAGVSVFAREGGTSCESPVIEEQGSGGNSPFITGLNSAFVFIPSLPIKYNCYLKARFRGHAGVNYQAAVGDRDYWLV